jgi:Site-specific recombinase XerD
MNEHDFAGSLTLHTPANSLQAGDNLDGRNGINRAAERATRISARTDIDAIKAWLATYAGSPNTFSSYRKEAERLYLWSTLNRNKPISSLTHEDLLAYQHFLGDPQPATQWVMASSRKVGRHHPDWRPFAGPLSANSRRQTMVILNAMFTWLVTAGYLAANPLALSRQRTRKTASRITRYLDEEIWAQVKQTIETMPRESQRQREKYLRTRWLFSLLYLCGLRVSEITGNDMGGFFCRRDNSGVERWWLEVTGKGEKTRVIPATQELMKELANYRREIGLPPSPAPGDRTPLLPPLGGEARPLTRAAIHIVVKQIFQATAARLRAEGEHREWQARQIEQASAHWLRHTAGSHMVNKGADLRHVRDNLGHASMTTTNIYLHSTDDERHRDTEEHHRIGW